MNEPPTIPHRRHRLARLGVAAVVGLLALVSMARGQSVTLAWDASPDDSPTNRLFYRLYAGTNGAVALTNLNVGTNLSATVDRLTPGMWRFWATAVTSNGVESLPSNLVIQQVPATPLLMRTITLQYAFALTNGGFQDVGFFRLKLQ